MLRSAIRYVLATVQVYRCFDRALRGSSNIYNINIKCSRNNQHNAQICTIVLFYMLAPTCFGSSQPSSESFWIRLSYVIIQIDMVVYHIMLVKLPVCRRVVVQSVVLPSWAPSWETQQTARAIQTRRASDIVTTPIGSSSVPVFS
jgi:hypothetical protein